jgi:serine/threonine protein kinase/WD40 repeat protein
VIPKLDEEAIFHGARQIEAPEARRTYLQQHCGDDAVLRARLEALLRVHDYQRSFLQVPPGDARAAREESSDETPGTVIGPYKLLQLIGEGGMGTVWMAEQSRPVHRKVALKVIRPGMDNKQVVARLEAERQALALMDHPNIAKVLDAGTMDEPGGSASGGGRPYFVMELVKGVPLTKYCDEHHLTPRQRLELFVPVCRAVQHAHQKGIIHRDLKPSNILVAPYDGKPVVKVIDFGVAKATGPKLTERTLFTEFGAVVGTLEYMSPEQAELNNQDIDTRSDIYSLGVLLYELLTGTTPLEPKRLKEGSLLDALRLIREEEPAPPSTRLSTTAALPAIAANRGLEPKKLSGLVRGELDWIVMKCLEKDRNRRYESANALAQDIERHLRGEAVQACPPSTVYRFRKFAQRNKAAFITTLAIVTSFLLAVVVLAVSTVRITRERDDKVNALEQAQRAERAAQEQLCDSLFVQARARRSSQQPGQRLESLKALEQAARHSRELGRGPADLAKLRSEAIACLALPDVRLEHEWEGSPTGTNGLGFDERFERYAWSFKDQGIRICRLSDHQELMRVPTLPAERASRWLRPRFSPDGRFLVVDYALWTSKRPLQVWDLSTGTPRPVLPPLADVATDPQFSPDGRALVVGLPDKSVRFFDLATGHETRQLPIDLLPERLAFHPDGQKLAVCSVKELRVQVHDLQSAKVLYKLPHPDYVEALAWHPEGQLLATGCDDHRIYLWDGASGERRGILEGHTWEIGDLAFNHAGDQLASYGWDMTLRLWNVATRRQLWHLENIRVVAFRPQEPLLAAGISGRQVQVWTCVPGTEFDVLRGPTDPVRTLDVSPDSRYVFGNTFAGSSWLWDVSRKRELAHFDDVQMCAWDAGGNIVLSTKQGQMLRRPVRNFPKGPGEPLDLGPAEDLFPPPLEPDVPYGFCWCGRDRRLLARLSPRTGVQVFRLDGTPRKLWERAVPDLGGGTIAASGDGRWLAIGTQGGGSGTSILEADSGQLVKKLPIGDAWAALSPDRRWLVTTSGRLTTPGGECCLWRTDTWEMVRARPLNRSTSSPACVVVSPDGAVVAVAHTMSQIKLLRLATLEEFAILTAPEPGIIVGMEFSPDGRHLFAVVGNTAHHWDLHALRQGLRSIGLDWDTPAPTDSGS